MKNLERVRWRARRGLLELDIIFERFVRTQYAELTEEEKRVFEALLDMADNPLLDKVMGTGETDLPEEKVLLEKIRAA
jgi:succinate dehydrogenase flavin-adding protein (antitoxin of CptAB toxin-antitoxin module)